MKSIIVDLPAGLAYPSSVLSAFKVYVKKNHFFNLTVCGDAANFSILEDTEGIECVYSDVGETSSHVALREMASREDVGGLISFADRLAFLKEARAILPHFSTASFGLSFSTKIPGKESLLLDPTGLLEKNQEQYEAALQYGKDYLLNVLGKASVEVALLGLEGQNDPFLNGIDQTLRASEKNYHGFLSPEHLFDGTADLILAGGIDGAIAILSAKGAATASKQMQKAEASRSWTSLFGKNKTGEENARFDSRIDQRGYLLFGAHKNLLLLNKDAGYGDVTDAFPVLEHLANKKIYQK